MTDDELVELTREGDEVTFGGLFVGLTVYRGTIAALGLRVGC